jgi:nucleoside-diphosphate-sugar epimerase
VGQRVALQLVGRVRVLALTSSADRIEHFRAFGIVPLLGNLDDMQTLYRLAGLAHRVLHLAPPQPEGRADQRTRALMNILSNRSHPRGFVYGSTSGVYGDCGGAHVSETRTVNAMTPRAGRRVDAEGRVRHWGQAMGARVCVLRIPGIYAPDREGGTPHARLMKGLPVLHNTQDVFTNHIHADDLARACALALWRGAPQRVYNVNDDTDLMMGDYFDVAAGIYGLNKPARVSRAEAMALMSPMQMSFMGESRRMDNARMKHELRLNLRYATVHQGLV